MSVLSLVSVGLILCILGAALIVRAFAFASFGDIPAKPAQKSNTPQSVVHTLCAQRTDALFGAPFLIAGFGLQLLSSLGVTEKPVVMFLVLAAAAVALLYYSLMRDMIATTATASILNEREPAREMPILIESKIEAPLKAPAFEYVEATAGA